MKCFLQLILCHSFCTFILSFNLLYILCLTCFLMCSSHIMTTWLANKSHSHTYIVSTLNIRQTSLDKKVASLLIQVETLGLGEFTLRLIYVKWSNDNTLNNYHTPSNNNWIHILVPVRINRHVLIIKLRKTSENLSHDQIICMHTYPVIKHVTTHVHCERWSKHEEMVLLNYQC